MKEKKFSLKTYSIPGVIIIILMVVGIYYLINNISAQSGIEKIKSSYLNACGEAPIGELVDNYMTNVKWEEKKSDKGYNVYNVTGNIMYDGEKSRALIQFARDEDNIIVKAFEINKIEKSNSTYAALVNEMCNASKKITIPDVKNMTEDDALEALYRAGFNGTYEYQYDDSDDIAFGKIIKTKPEAGKIVKANSTIILYKSTNSVIKNIDMTVEIDKNGTATITEKWTASPKEGTEGWHPYSGLDNMEIKLISASMDEKKYEIVENWNENASLQDKAYKAGLYPNDSEGYDIVFGISEYGKHEYKITYTITNFVRNLIDSDVTYFTLLPYNFSSETNFKIKIKSYYDFDDGLTYRIRNKYDIKSYVKKGSLYIESKSGLKTNEYITVLIKYPKDTYTTTVKETESYADYNQWFDMVIDD